jgi:hypothetical protein
VAAADVNPKRLMKTIVTYGDGRSDPSDGSVADPIARPRRVAISKALVRGDLGGNVS